MNKYEEIIKVNSGLIYMIMNKYFKGYDKGDGKCDRSIESAGGHGGRCCR